MRARSVFYALKVLKPQRIDLCLYKPNREFGAGFVLHQLTAFKCVFTQKLGSCIFKHLTTGIIRNASVPTASWIYWQFSSNLHCFHLKAILPLHSS